MLKDKHEAFDNSLKDIVNKFRDNKGNLEQKMRLFQEYGTRAAPKKPSYGNAHDNEYGDYAPYAPVPG